MIKHDFTCGHCGSSYVTKNEARQCADSHQCSHTERTYKLRVLRDSSLAIWCSCKKCGKFIEAAYLDELDWDDNQDILEQLYNKGKHHEL